MRYLKKVCKAFITLYCYFVFISIGLFILYVILQIFVFGSFKIPSESMMPTIIPGDNVIMEKMSTGARLFDFRKTARGERTKIVRTPHWRDFQRGDILVFNYLFRESTDTISMNWRTYYLKRCLAIPGDTIEIKDFEYYVNGKKLDRYYTKKDIEYRFPSDSAARDMNLRGYMIDRSDTIDRWTIRDLGPYIIPESGMTLPIDITTLRRYKRIIEWETGKSLTVIDGKVYLGDKEISEYTFLENYYFMAGDNTPFSRDSRYFGPVPEEFIVGRPRFIWWSEKNGKIKWDRFFKVLK